MPPGRFTPFRPPATPAHAHAVAQAGGGHFGGPNPTIQPPPKPLPVKKAPAKPKSQTVSQAANSQVNQQLAPVLGAQDKFNTTQNAAIQSFALALLGKLEPIPGQVGSDYDKAIGQTAALSGATADALRNANPNQQDQQLLQSINAPQAQQQQVQSKLADTFGGGAAALQFTQGEVPGSMLASNKASSQAEARKLPGIAALKGQQDLSSALYQQGQTRASTLAQRPALFQQAVQNIKGNNAQKSAAAFDQYKFETARADAYTAAGMKQEAAMATHNADLAYKYASLGSQNQRSANTVSAANQRFVLAEEGRNKRAQAAAAKAGVKTSGKGQLTQQQISNLVDKWKNGKVEKVPVAQTKADGTVVRDVNGAVVYKNQAGSSGQLGYLQAYKRLTSFGKSDAEARKILNTAYKRGEQGRSWVSNEEQAALAKAKLPPKAHVVNGHGVLTPAQYQALKKARKLPPGQVTAEGAYVIANVF